MPRGYALDRCWIARPTALCETCCWFVEDTHPEYPTFGLDAGERCSSKQKYYHNMHPCKTPEVVYVCELAKDVQDSVMIDDDVDDDECDGGDSFDAAGAAADAAAAASAATVPMVAEEEGPRRGRRVRTETRRD